MAQAPRRLVLILGALSAFAPLSMDMYLPGLPELGRDLGASASAVQVTLTAFREVAGDRAFVAHLSLGAAAAVRAGAHGVRGR